MMVKALYGLGIEAALLCLWLAVPAFRPELRTSSEAVEASTSGYAYDVQACGADSSFPGMLQGIIHGLAILLLSAVSFRARNAPTAFQESNWLSLILMEVVTVGGISAIVYYAMADSLAMRQLLLVQSLGINICTTIGCLLMLVPKALGKHEFRTEGQIKQDASKMASQQRSQLRDERSSQVGGAKVAHAPMDPVIEVK